METNVQTRVLTNVKQTNKYKAIAKQMFKQTFKQMSSKQTNRKQLENNCSNKGKCRGANKCHKCRGANKCQGTQNARSVVGLKTFNTYLQKPGSQKDGRLGINARKPRGNETPPEWALPCGRFAKWPAPCNGVLCGGHAIGLETACDVRDIPSLPVNGEKQTEIRGPHQLQK